MPVYYAYSYITHREIYAVRDIQEILGSYIMNETESQTTRLIKCRFKSKGLFFIFS